MLFTEPLAHVIPLEDEAAGRLRGCCLCVSSDGTIAVIAIDGFNLCVISLFFFHSRKILSSMPVVCT